MPEQEYLVVEHLSTKELTRIFAKIEVSESGCWIYHGRPSDKGKYQTLCYKGKYHLAHRFMYAWLVESIPKCKERPRTYCIDHIICNNPPCCNPAHLKLVLQQDNILRSNAWSGVNARKTHCPKGHLLPTKANTSVNRRICRLCRHLRYLRQKQVNLLPKTNYADDHESRLP